MADVYSTRFVQAHDLDGDVAYVVPDGYRAILRDIDWFAAAPADSPTGGYCYGAAGQSLDWFTVDLDTTLTHQWRGRQVFEPGEAITFHGDGSVDVTASGYLLTLP